MNIQQTSGYNADRLKALVYGEAGIGKTYSMRTLPEPAATLIVSVEGGLMSLSDCAIDCVEARSIEDLREVVRFLQGSEHGYTWIVLDSASELAELVLAKAQDATTDGRKAYGDLNKSFLRFLRGWRDLPYHCIATAHLGTHQEGDNGPIYKAPNFPGRTLTAEAPYIFDATIAMRMRPDEQGNPQRVFQCQQDNGRWIAKARMLALDTYEPADWSALYTKATGG